MNEAGVGTINADRVSYLRELINADNSIYSWLEENGYQKGTMIPCIFHAERKPSMSITENKGKWQCFSCGRAGGWLELSWFNETVNRGRNISKAQYAEELLNTHPEWKQKYGISSLREEPVFSLEHIEYLLKCGRAGRQQRLQLAAGKTIDEYDDGRQLNPTNIIWEKFQSLTNIDEIVDMASRVQKGIINFK